MAQRTVERIGKKVRAISRGDDFTGIITSGSLATGRWIVAVADGTSRKCPGSVPQQIAPGGSTRELWYR
ncbi:hypothetical protein ACIBEJ_33670 [Nonomuraea sp. NPDC050790]|uniref:hypothetical protein n=1 Tax=Nonomuraea sp. NPDC050790 TaxID=3364371 RepID=UPI0037BBD4FA